MVNEIFPWSGRVLSLSDEDFLARFHAQFGDRVGKFLSVERRMAFPLKLSKLTGNDLQHLVVIGNAAQTMHPVAGQGFNVGLRDAESLASVINQTQYELGSDAMLAHYSETRTKDTNNGLMFTDFLVSIFTNDLVGMQHLRSVGIGLFDLIKPIKAHLVRKMSYGK